MRVVVQRCSQAQVCVDDRVVGAIKKGFVLLVGIAEHDTQEDIDYLVNKIAQLRIFEDDAQKMNLSIQDVSGAILSISQFTLLANTKKGNRPSFVEAAQPEKAKAFYEKFNAQLREKGLVVETGIFGANMQVSLTNDGPVTIVYDSYNR